MDSFSGSLVPAFTVDGGGILNPKISPVPTISSEHLGCGIVEVAVAGNFEGDDMVAQPPGKEDTVRVSNYVLSD